MSGKVNISTSGENTTITLDGEKGTITAGGSGQDGALACQDVSNRERIRVGRIREGLDGGPFVAGPGGAQLGLNADYWGIVVRSQNELGLIRLGKTGSDIRLNPGNHRDDSVVLDGVNANIRLGGNDTAGGDIALFPKNATAADLNSFDNAIIHLNGNNGIVVLRQNKQDSIVLNGNAADILLGGNGQDGSIFLYSKWVSDIGTFKHANIQLLAETGSINIRNGLGNVIIRLEPVASPLHNQDPGSLTVDPGGRITVSDLSGNDTIVIDGNQGDIVLENADCAEEFEIDQSEEVEPGTVMVLDQEGKLRQSKEPYDRKVAGVISGAGGFKPGIVLDRRLSQNKRRPVAMTGKVYCKVDARYSPIEVGDLLTTSPTFGHAMKASEPARAFGAVIGKALATLTEGQGIVPILVALQ